MIRTYGRWTAFVAGVIALVVAAPATPAQSAEAEKTLSLDLGKGVRLELVLIPAGSFLMGDAKAEGRDEKPAHKVAITRPFYLGKYEVTQEQWQAVMGDNPSGFPAPNSAVECVSWDDCQAFCKKLNEKFAAGGVRFGLPTEAQWEYACRAGTTGPYSFADKEAGQFAWTKDNAEDKPHPVGQKKPNPWGLYDIHGNLFEWCEDWYDAGYYASSPAADPPGPASGTQRVLRGGSWDYRSVFVRCAYRLYSPPSYRCGTYGFRVMGAR